MISRSDWEPLPTPTLSPFALARPGTFLSVSVFGESSLLKNEPQYPTKGFFFLRK